MNNSYSSYVNYIQSTNYYNNLSSALTKIGTISDSVDSLINALGKNNGHNITSAIDDLQSFKTKLNKISSYYSSLKNSLNYNAEQYDKLYNEKKSLSNSSTSVYKFDGQQVEGPEISSKIFNSFNFGIHNVTKTVHKILVCMSSDPGYVGYIKVVDMEKTTNYNIKFSVFGGSYNLETETPKSYKIGYPIISMDAMTYYYNRDGVKIGENSGVILGEDLVDIN